MGRLVRREKGGEIGYANRRGKLGKENLGIAGGATGCEDSVNCLLDGTKVAGCIGVSHREGLALYLGLVLLAAAVFCLAHHGGDPCYCSMDALPDALMGEYSAKQKNLRDRRIRPVPKVHSHQRERSRRLFLSCEGESLSRG